MVRRHRLSLVLVLALLALAAGAVIYITDPAESLLLPKCPFRLLTGLDCPTCGSTRAVHYILHGHIAQGLAFNPVAPVLWLLGGAIILIYTVMPRRASSPLARFLVVAFLAVYILWGVIRNLI